MITAKEVAKLAVKALDGRDTMTQDIYSKQVLIVFSQKFFQSGNLTGSS